MKLPLLDEPVSAERLTKEIEASFDLGEATSTSSSVTGEPYVSIGQQAGGKAKFPGTVDEAGAYWAAREAFQLYAEGRKGILYWRVKPQMELHEGFRFIYMRCLISDKPVIAAKAA